MSILINSVPSDLHAVVLKWALDKAGIVADWFTFPDLPDKLNFALRVQPGKRRSLSWCGTSECRSPLGYSVVWNRRFIGTSIPQDAHPSDRKHIERHGTVAASWLKRELSDGALAINPIEAEERARNKMVQLKCADAVGLKIPPTLFSNDAAQIGRFQAEYGEIIGKPVDTIYYDKGAANLQTMTELLPPVEGLDHRSFAYMPYIFQPHIKKRSEVRIFVLGQNLFAAEILSQELPDARVDFRMKAKDLTYRSIAIPVNVERNIRQFMLEMGIIFGQFDFIITNSGEWIFLEVNSQGNWLWLETHLPSLTLVDCFTKFVLAADPDYQYVETQSPDFTFSDFKAEFDFAQHLKDVVPLHNTYSFVQKSVEYGS